VASYYVELSRTVIEKMPKVEEIPIVRIESTKRRIYPHSLWEDDSAGISTPERNPRATFKKQRSIWEGE